MATLMEKDALLNGASQCIAFLSNIIDNCSVSSHQDSGDALKRLVSYLVNSIVHSYGHARYQRFTGSFHSKPYDEM